MWPDVIEIVRKQERKEQGNLTFEACIYHSLTKPGLNT